ncbi:helix-turn-helix domain-containing protein [Streptomyces syringium]|uniref:helix-turn-helix domain-containing protein n=1 Tax=Streptomyces syringium TaxID=76729 RepID=UPI0033A576D1
MAHLAKSTIALRLRYIRHSHPEGPFSLAKLAARAGVSKRTLASAESADGTNLTIETLMKVAQSLGIRRPAYFLDEQVFREVNAELETVRALRQQTVHTVALRSAAVPGAANASVSELSELVKGIIVAAQAAGNTLQNLPDPANGYPDPGARNK